jgi:hypothetical protein
MVLNYQSQLPQQFPNLPLRSNLALVLNQYSQGRSRIYKVFTNKRADDARNPEQKD